MTIAYVKYAANGGTSDIASASWAAYDYIQVEQYNPAAQICPAIYERIPTPASAVSTTVSGVGGSSLTVASATGIAIGDMAYDVTTGVTIPQTVLSIVGTTVTFTGSIVGFVANTNTVQFAINVPLTFVDTAGQWWQCAETTLNPAMAGATGNPQGDDSFAFNALWAFLSSFLSGKFLNQAGTIDLGNQSWRIKKPIYWTDNGQIGRIEIGNGTIMASNNDGLCPIAVDLAGSQGVNFREPLFVTGLTAEPGIASMTLNTSAATNTGNTTLATTGAAGSNLNFASTAGVVLGMIAYDNTTKTLISGYVTAINPGVSVTFSVAPTGVSNGDSIIFVPNVLQFSSTGFPTWIVVGMQAHDMWAPPALTQLTVLAVQTSGGTTYVSLSGPVQQNVVSGDQIAFLVQPPDIGIRLCRSQARSGIITSAGGSGTVSVWTGAGRHDLRFMQLTGAFKEASLLNYGSEANRYPTRGCSNAWGQIMPLDGATLVTSASTAANGNVLTFASVPPWVQPGMVLASQLSPSAIPNWVSVLSTTSTTVTLTGNIPAGILKGDTIGFTQASKYGQMWLNTNAATAANGNTLSFTSLPTWIRVGMTAVSTGNPTGLNGMTVIGISGGTVTMSGNITAGISNGDTITFSAPPMMSNNLLIVASSDYVYKYSPALSGLGNYQNPSAVINGTGTSTSTFTTYDSVNPTTLQPVGNPYQATLKVWPWDRLDFYPFNVSIATTTTSNGASPTINFSATLPPWIVTGMTARDISSLVAPNPLTGLTVTGLTATSVTFSGNVPTGIIPGDIIAFSVADAQHYTPGINNILSCTDHNIGDFTLTMPSPIGVPRITAIDTVNNLMTLSAVSGGLLPNPQPLRDGTPIYMTNMGGGVTTTASGYSVDSGGATTLYVSSVTGITAGMIVSDQTILGGPLDGLTVISTNAGAGTVLLSGLASTPIPTGDTLLFGAPVANSNIFYLKTVEAPLPSATTYNVQLYADRFLTINVPMSELGGFTAGNLWGATGSDIVVSGGSAFCRGFGYGLTYGAPFVLFDGSYGASGTASDSWSLDIQHEAVPLTSVEYILPSTGTVSCTNHRFVMDGINQNWEHAAIAAESVGTGAGILWLTDLELDVTSQTTPPKYGMFKNPSLILPINWNLKLPKSAYMNPQPSFHSGVPATGIGAMRLSFYDLNQNEEAEDLRSWTPNLQFQYIAVNAATPMGSAVLNFSSVPASFVVGAALMDISQPGALAGLTIASKTAMTVTMSGNVSAPIASGDLIIIDNTLRVATNAGTTTASAVLNFTSVPSWVYVGMQLYDVTTPAALAGLTVSAKTATTVTMSGNVLANVGSGDSIAPGNPCILGTANGWWQRYKNSIHAHFSIKVANLGTGTTGFAGIVNLPVLSNNSAYFGSVSISNYTGMAAIGVSIGGEVLASQQAIARFLNGGATGVTVMTGSANFTQSSVIEGDIFYLAKPLQY